MLARAIEYPAVPPMIGKLLTWLLIVTGLLQPGFSSEAVAHAASTSAIRHQPSP